MTQSGPPKKRRTKLKSKNWKNTAELVGIAAIVASLIFVGLQLKQSQEIALADQYQARTEAAQTMFLAIQESGISMASLGKPLSEKTPAEITASINVSYWTWTQYDNHHFQYSAGFLDDESWEGIARRIQRQYDLCDRRSVWESMKQYIRRSFVGYVESLEDKCQ